MASRWRTWDAHFATDILGNKLTFDTFDSLPVGTRGRFRFNIPINRISVFRTETDSINNNPIFVDTCK